MKRILQFLIGGTIYFLVELIFRFIVNHRPPHLVAFIMGGLAVIFTIYLEGRLRLNIMVKALLSGSFVTILELLIGSYFKFVKHDPLWSYSGITFYNIISLHWWLLWCGLALIFLICYRLIIKIIRN